MSSQRLARLTGILYAVNFAIGITAMVLARQGPSAAADAMNLAGAVEYALVVVLIGRLFQGAGAALSWSVAAIGLAGCITGLAGALHLFGSTATALAVFGLYCLALGALVLRSRLMPRAIGLLLMLGGLGWLTYADLPLARSLQPYNIALGIIGELIFTLWLLAAGLRAETHVEESAPEKIEALRGKPA
jgi:hypothetical protein